MIYNSISLLAFVGICQWTPLSDELFWFLWIDFNVMHQLIGLGLIGVSTHKKLEMNLQFFRMNLNMVKL